MPEPTAPQDPKVALDRVAFLTAFVPYLVANGGGPVPVAEAAKHFGTSEAFIRRSAESLTVMGVPGDGALYMSNDLFDIDWDALDEHDELILTNRVAIDDVPRLSAREAAAILAGLEILGQDPVIAGSAEYAGLRQKLASSSMQRPEAPTIELPEVPGFSELRAAIAAGRQVRFRYRTAGSDTTRTRRVDPVRLDAIDAVYQLRAWCHDRADFRTFRLDRIQQLEVLDAAVTHSAAELASVRNGFTPGDGAFQLEVEFDAAAVDLVEGYRPDSLRVDSASGLASMTVTVVAEAVVRRLLAELPGARISAPPAVVAGVRSWTADALSRYHADGA